MSELDSAQSLENEIKRIADILEFFKYCVYGLILAGLIFGVGFAVITISPIIYDYISYDILNNERPEPTVYQASFEPFDVCGGDDKSTCFQIERLATIMEFNLSPEQKKELDMKLYFQYGIEPSTISDDKQSWFKHKFYNITNETDIVWCYQVSADGKTCLDNSTQHNSESVSRK